MVDKILLVEDDLDVLESYKTLLKFSGIEIITCTDGKQALELYKKHQPCMVFSDIMMPDMDGYELFSRIREFDPAAKVILITGFGDKEKTVIAKNKGLLDILYKPFENNTLKLLIEKHSC